MKRTFDALDNISRIRRDGLGRVIRTKRELTTTGMGGAPLDTSNPNNPDGIHRTIPLRNQSLSTSGDYVQYFEQNGRRYSHTLDPRTGWPITHDLASVTVVHASSAMADAWATALNVLGPEEGSHLAWQQHLPVLMILRTPHGFAEKMTIPFKNLIAGQTAP
jgi:thiamine biosynthesis lipoprotein ApbE